MKMFKKLFAVLMLVVGLSVMPAQADVTVIDGNLVIENVWWQPLGLVNLTVPWDDAQVAGYVDLLHGDVKTIIGAEGAFMKQPVMGRLLAVNVVVASVLTGEQKKGLFGASVNFSSGEPNISENWSGGVWFGSAFDGTGLWGGYKIFNKF
jgi:hypothetical protein